MPYSILITRPTDGANRLVRALSQKCPVKADVILSPLIEIEFIDIGPVDWASTTLILTSQNGVESAQRAGAPVGTSAYCVGDGTAQAGQAIGLSAISAKGNADDLVDLILGAAPPGRLLHLHGEVTRGNVAERLLAQGLHCDAQVAYRQRALELVDAAKMALMGTDPLIVPLLSPRTASLLVQQGPFSAPLHIIALSESVAQAAADLESISLTTVRNPRLGPMISAICHHLGGNLEASGP